MPVAPVDDGGAAHLMRGASLPDIALPSTLGGEVSLGQLKGKWIVFLYRWTGAPGRPNPPAWDDIPGAHGSTPEAEGFGDHYEAFRSQGFDVLGVSGQSADEQKEFQERVRLPFQLLSDSDGKLRTALRLPTFTTGGAVYLKRLTFVLIDGRLDRVEYPVHPPGTHAGHLLSKLPARN